MNPETFGYQAIAALGRKAKELARKLKFPEEWAEVLDSEYQRFKGQEKPVRATRKPKTAELTHEEWLKSLEAEPHLKGLNIRAQVAACTLWYRTNIDKKGDPSRKRIVNWLNKAASTADLKSQGASYASNLKLPPKEGPEGWLEWLKVELANLPDDHPAQSQLLYALNSRQFTGLPVSWQQRCHTTLVSSHLTELPRQDSQSIHLRHA